MLPMAYYYIKWCDQIVISIKMVRGHKKSNNNNDESILKGKCVCALTLFAVEKLSPHFNCVHLKSVLLSRSHSLTHWIAMLCPLHENVSEILATELRTRPSIQRQEIKTKQTHNILVSTNFKTKYILWWINICYVLQHRDLYWVNERSWNRCIAFNVP